MRRGNRKILVASFFTLAYAFSLSVATSQTLTPRDAISIYRELDQQCRGGSGDSPETFEACERRDEARCLLNEQNWCFGKDGEFSAQMRWHLCTLGSNRSETCSEGDELVTADVLGEEMGSQRVPLSQQLSVREQGELLRSITKCWNPNSLQNSTVFASVRIAVEYDVSRRPTLVEPHRVQPTSTAIDSEVYQAARRAVLRCSGSQLDLPQDRYGGWQSVFLTFASDGITFDTYSALSTIAPQDINSADQTNIAGRTQIGSNTLSEAQRMCDALASDPLDPLRRTGGVEFLDLDFENARRWCGFAVSDAPDDLTSQFNFARIYVQLGGYEAGDMINILAQKGYPISFFYQGVLYENGLNGFNLSINHAIISFKRALDSGVIHAANRLGLLYAEHGEPDTALFYWRKGVELGDGVSADHIASLEASIENNNRLDNRVVGIFGPIPEYPTFDIAVALLGRYASICRANRFFCEFPCQAMSENLYEVYDSPLRDNWVPQHYSICVNAIYSDLRQLR